MIDKKLFNYLNESPTVFFILKKVEGIWELEYVTENVINFYGRKAEEFLNKIYQHIDFIHKADLKSFNEQASQISKIKENTFTYKPYRIVNGSSIIWINHTTKIIRDKKGKPEYYYGYLTDITKQKEIDKELVQTTNVLDSIFNNSFNFILLLDNKGKLVKANERSLEIAGVKENEVINKYFWDLPWWKYCTKEEKKKLREEIEDLKKGACLKNHKYYYNTNSKRIDVDFSFSPVFDEELNVTHILCEGHDITQSKNTEKQLGQYMSIVNDNVLISIADLKGNIVNMSDAYCRLTGYSRDEVIGKSHKIFKHPDNEEYIFKELWDTITRGKIWKGEHKNIKKDGSIYWVENSITPNFDEDNNITGYTSIYNNITDKKEISELLITDYLTKIYNRRHFNDVFSLEVKRAKREKYNFVLMILDIDYFKQYNDTYGHDAGDRALINVSNALKFNLHRPNDFIFRLGGEEFGVITSNVDINGVRNIANKLRKSVEDLLIEHKASEVSDYLTISIGIKIVKPEESIEEEKIYKLADLSLYESKDRGRNQFTILDE